MIKIDFHGSTHGHFLEYVSNVYIMQTDAGQSKLFNSNGAAHEVDDVYLENRQIYCDHYSSLQIPFASNDKVIRITIDSDDDNQFYIALVNAIYRAGDVGFEKHIMQTPDVIRNQPVEHRNNWYSKITERHKYMNLFTDFDQSVVQVYDFPFTSFYSFQDFCKNLNALAFALNETFFPDQSLGSIWKKFIDLNQGYHSHRKCQQILENIFANADMEFDCTIIEQGWINYNLSKICRMYTGSMFENEHYPTNTKEIYKEVCRHLEWLRTG